MTAGNRFSPPTSSEPAPSVSFTSPLYDHFTISSLRLPLFPLMYEGVHRSHYDDMICFLGNSHKATYVQGVLYTEILERGDCDFKGRKDETHMKYGSTFVATTSKAQPVRSRC